MDAVVAGEIARRLARRDDVIRGDAVLGVRERHVDDRRAQRLILPDGRIDGGLHLRVHPGRQLEFLGDADAQPFHGLLQIGQIIGHGRRNAGGVLGIVPADDVHEQRGVGDGPAERADLVERAGEGDQPIPADAAVGGLETDQAAQRRRLADRAAGVGAERRAAHPRRQRRGRCRRCDPPGTRMVSHGLRVVLKALFSVETAHRELVEIGLADDHRAGGLELAHDGASYGARKFCQHLRGAGGRAEARAEIVFERDRHAGQRAGALAVVDRPRLLQGPLGIGAVEGEDLRFELFDPGQRLARQLERTKSSSLGSRRGRRPACRKRAWRVKVMRHNRGRKVRGNGSA